MTRVIIICEGSTERDFVKKIVAPHLLGFGINALSPLLGKPGKKGGDVKGARIVGDVTTNLLNDQSAYCTTFLDFYGMKSDVPGRSEAASKDGHKNKKQIVEDAIFNAIKEKVGDTSIRRFKSYVQMYEFEGLLFSNIKKMSLSLGDGDSKIEKQILDGFGKILEKITPEEINDSKETAPSKRIGKIVSGYEDAKITKGIPLAKDIGLIEIREKCPLFNEWINWLESLSRESEDN